LDEPTLGLAPLMVEEIFQLLRKLTEENRSILVAEQNLSAVLRHADYLYFLNQGRIVEHGPRSSFTDDQSMIKQYFS
jgi:branched-chain amino acid transport system ATP-binding protein